MRPAQDPAGCIEHARRTLTQLPHQATGPKAVLSLQIGVTYFMMGRPALALDPLVDCERWGMHSGNAFAGIAGIAGIAGMGYRAGCLLLLGRLRDGEALCVQALNFASQHECSLLGVT